MLRHEQRQNRFLRCAAEMTNKRQARQRQEQQQFVAPLGLHSGLRQSGSAFGAVFFGRAEALPFRVLRHGNRSGGKDGDGNGNGNYNRSLRPSGFTPAFGRVVAPSARSFLAGLKPCPSGF